VFGFAACGAWICRLRHLSFACACACLALKKNRGKLPGGGKAQGKKRKKQYLAQPIGYMGVLVELQRATASCHVQRQPRLLPPPGHGPFFTAAAATAVCWTR
jgi:hypothetical protein